MEMAKAIQVLRQSLTGAHPVDCQTQDSIAILAEKMEQLKQRYPLLSEMGFSREVERLAGQSAATVC